MKRLFLIVAVILTSATIVNAQEQYKLFFFHAGAGVHVACDNVSADQKLYGTTPAFDFGFGVRPVGGLNLRVGFQGFKAKRDEVSFNYGYAHFDAMWSITEMKCITEKGKCKHFIAAPYLSAGGGFGDKVSFGYGAGALIGARLNNHFDILLDGRATRLKSSRAFAGGTGKCSDVSATINLVYNF